MSNLYENLIVKKGSKGKIEKINKPITSQKQLIDFKFNLYKGKGSKSPFNNSKIYEVENINNINHLNNINNINNINTNLNEYKLPIQKFIKKKSSPNNLQDHNKINFDNLKNNIKITLKTNTPIAVAKKNNISRGNISISKPRSVSPIDSSNYKLNILKRINNNKLKHFSNLSKNYSTNNNNNNSNISDLNISKTSHSILNYNNIIAKHETEAEVYEKPYDKVNEFPYLSNTLIHKINSKNKEIKETKENGMERQYSSSKKAINNNNNNHNSNNTNNISNISNISNIDNYKLINLKKEKDLCKLNLVNFECSSCKLMKEGNGSTFEKIDENINHLLTNFKELKKLDEDSRLTIINKLQLINTEIQKVITPLPKYKHSLTNYSKINMQVIETSFNLMKTYEKLYENLNNDFIEANDIIKRLEHENNLYKALFAKLNIKDNFDIDNNPNFNSIVSAKSDPLDSIYFPDKVIMKKVNEDYEQIKVKVPMLNFNVFKSDSSMPESVVNGTNLLDKTSLDKSFLGQFNTSLNDNNFSNLNNFIKSDPNLTDV